ncbi:MFS family permease [Virgibacillus halotolerans]|uniref:MFS transporter n=1 Tax=Virgibacillus halotolerans TaxID=1071053 RepID=UPI0019614B33|nr:MFS transporter [Virgibacillus halotolerans]MBM7601456.1 MFS family permease [Virgibacillus halotolerans]
MSEKLWTKDFMLITLVNFLMYIIHYSLIVTITLFTIEEYQANEGMGGLAAGIFIIGMLVGRLYSGKYIDQWQPKYILLIGLVASVLTISLYFTIQSLAILLIVRFLHGIAFGISSTSTGAIASKIVPEHRKGEGIGYYALSTTVASAIGPFVGILINQQLGFEMNFTFCLATILVAFLIGFTIKKIKVVPISKQEAQQSVSGVNKYLQKEALPISFVAIFVGVAYASVLSFLTAYAQTINLVYFASFFFIVYAVSTLVSRPFTGKIFDRFGENKVMYPSFLCFMIGLALLATATNGFLLLLSAIFIGLGYGTLIPSSQAIAVKSSPIEKIGLATSTFYMFADLGAGFAPFLLGMLIPLLGYRNLYWSMALLVIAVSILYYFLHGKNAHQERKANHESMTK